MIGEICDFEICDFIVPGTRRAGCNGRPGSFRIMQTTWRKYEHSSPRYALQSLSFS
jgi:hypothetical protein